MEAMLDPVGVAIGLRPQGFGSASLARIRDPLVEPLWTGPRVLAAITPTAAALIHEGRRLDAPRPLLDALAAAAQTAALVVEGVLTAEALASGEGAFPVPETKVPRPGRLVFAGSLGGRRERLLRERGEGARAAAEEERRLRSIFDEPVAFVATDLIWLDGDPLLEVPLLERKRLLEAVLGESELVRRTAFVRPTAGGSLIAWRSLGFVNLAYKEANSRYTPGTVNEGWTTAPAPAVAGPRGGSTTGV